MRKLVALGALVTSTSIVSASSSAHAQTDPDPWWGRDKALHFTVAGAIAGVGYGVGTAFLDHRWQCAVFGGGLAVGAGAAKELLDMTGTGDPSWKDFTWDVNGAAVGLGVAIAIDALVRPRDASSPSSTATTPLLVRF